MKEKKYWLFNIKRISKEGINLAEFLILAQAVLLIFKLTVFGDEITWWAVFIPVWAILILLGVVLILFIVGFLFDGG